MRRKTAEELATERDQIEARIREVRALEAKQAKQQEGHRHRLLGIKLEMLMACDERLRTRMAIEMNGYCTRPYDRQVFGLSEPGTGTSSPSSGRDTYFHRLGLPDDDPRKIYPARGRKKDASSAKAPGRDRQPPSSDLPRASSGGEAVTTIGLAIESELSGDRPSAKPPEAPPIPTPRERLPSPSPASRALSSQAVKDQSLNGGPSHE